MEITTTTIEKTPSRRAAVNTLAAVGFIALLFIGIALAIYSARYVPVAISRLGSAAVSLSSVFRPASEEPELQVVSVASTTLPIEGDVLVVSTTTATTTSAAPARTTPRAGTATEATYTVVTTTNEPIAPYGDPDLTVTITDVGYLRTNNTNSFVRSNDVPDGKQGAVKFTVTNAGTNVTGKWEFKANVPTAPSFTFTSPSQRSLNPGDRIEYVLGFTKGREGDNRVITITVDSGKDVRESNEGNNDDSERIDIED